MKHVIATLALICAAPLTALAQDISTGATLYQRHCATCHGVDADGKGPMRPALLLQPPSLLDLAARNDGTFPIIRVVSRIDGRDPLVSHGSPMPVYGWYFEGEDTSHQGRDRPTDLDQPTHRRPDGLFTKHPGVRRVANVSGHAGRTR